MHAATHTCVKHVVFDNSTHTHTQVSFFEWVQNLQNFKWDEDDVNRCARAQGRGVAG
jgi:hypothetical protein